MQYLVLLTIVVVVAAASPFELAEDEDGQQYYLVPVSREKRQIKWGISDTGFGASHTGTILNNNNHRLDGTASVGKNFGSHGLRPDHVGGRLDYAHKPSGSNAFISADNARRFGTDVNAGVNYNVYHRKNFDVGVTGQYGRHFGGPSGTGRPDGYVGLTATGRF